MIVFLMVMNVRASVWIRGEHTEEEMKKKRCLRERKYKVKRTRTSIRV